MSKNIRTCVKPNRFLLWGMFLFVLHVFFIQPAVNCYFSDFEKNTEVSELMDEQDLGEDDVEDNDCKDEKYHMKQYFEVCGIDVDYNILSLFTYPSNYNDIALEVPNLPPKLNFC